MSSFKGNVSKHANHKEIRPDDFRAEMSKTAFEISRAYYVAWNLDQEQTAGRTR
jgi:hypothetical protein